MVQMMMATGRTMIPRQALLVISKSGDSKLELPVDGDDGDWPIANERISQYALCPWVVPIVLDTNDW